MQLIPSFDWSDNAKKVREYVYKYWGEHSYPPSTLDINRALGLERRQIHDALYELQLGGMCVVDLESPHLSLLRFLPYSSYPTVVKGFIGDRFLGYIGCAMESIAFSKMPAYSGEEVRLESYCSCCLTPLTVKSKNGEATEWPDGLLVHVGLTPLEWNRLNHNPMCDTMNFVLNEGHADKYERMTSRRGVVFNRDQAHGLVKGVADSRQWDYEWVQGTGNPDGTLAAIKGLGVNVGNWEH